MRCKGVYCVDLGESFQMSTIIYYSLLKLGFEYDHILVCIHIVIPNLVTHPRDRGKLYMARSLPYRSRFLQVNTHWKALAEIYTIHSFAPHSNLKFFSKILLKFCEILQDFR